MKRISLTACIICIILGVLHAFGVVPAIKSNALSFGLMWLYAEYFLRNYEEDKGR
jgi:hypothetical protein